MDERAGSESTLILKKGKTVTHNRKKTKHTFSWVTSLFDLKHFSDCKHLTLTVSLVAGVCKCMGTRSSGTQGGFLARVHQLWDLSSRECSTHMFILHLLLLGNVVDQTTWFSYGCLLSVCAYFFCHRNMFTNENIQYIRLNYRPIVCVSGRRPLVWGGGIVSLFGCGRNYRTTLCSCKYIWGFNTVANTILCFYFK